MSTDTVQTPNYYQEFGVDKDDSTEEIQRRLAKIREQWRTRGPLGGRRGEEARLKLEMLEAANEVFSSDEAREAYDRLLYASPAVVETDDEIDWVSRAWTYYFADDTGAARVAARKARDSRRGDPNAYVISAWVELSEENWTQAKDYSDEAFVIDELGEDTVDVHTVRGVTFYCVDKPEMAIKSFMRAWGKAPSTMLPNIAWRMAVCYLKMEQYDKAVDACLKGLAADEHVSIDTVKDLNGVCFNALERQCIIQDNPSRSFSLFKGARFKVTSLVAPDRNKRALLEFIDLHIKAAELAAFPHPGEGPSKSQMPSFPAVSTVIAVFFLLATICSQHWAPLLATLAFAARPAYYAHKLYEYKEQVKAHEAKKVKYQAMQEELSSTRKQIGKLKSQQS